MYSRVITLSLSGLEGDAIYVETDITRGLPGFNVVGLAGASIKEAWLRVRSGLMNSGLDFPSRKITINLSPANKRKEGSHFDLPIAMGIILALRASEGSMPECQKQLLTETAFVGELSLTGELAPIRGALPLALCAREKGLKRIVVPGANGAEAALVKGLDVVPCHSLKQALALFDSSFLDADTYTGTTNVAGPAFAPSLDFAQVLGQEEAKRALTIAAAGGHGLLMVGSPGAGKTMLAARLPSILPPMTYDEEIEATKVYSVAGLLNEERPLINERPFRRPHHSITRAALIGGGNPPGPGEFSLAHEGVLFLDELCEYGSYTLNCLRQPLEKGEVTIARSGGSIVFPGRVMLVAATNPCRCGYFGDSVKKCTCTLNEVRQYRSKLSGPLLDRIDIRIGVERVEYGEAEPGLSSAEMREMVLNAREMQRWRYLDEAFSFNGNIPDGKVEEYCVMEDQGEMLKEAGKALGLTMRGVIRTLKVARTIADIEGSELIKREHVAEALSYRGDSYE